MAALITDINYGEIKEKLYIKGNGKEELKALTTLPDETLLRAAFQVLENFYEDNKLQVKTDLETALGMPISGTLAKQISNAFFSIKLRNGG